MENVNADLVDFWSEDESKFSAEKPKVFKKDDNRDFLLLQNLTMGEAIFNQFMQLGNQLLVAAESSDRERNFSAALIPTMSKNMEERLKLAHKVVDVGGRRYRNICVNLLRYRVDKPESSHAQVRKVATKKEDDKFQQNIYVK